MNRLWIFLIALVFLMNCTAPNDTTEKPIVATATVTDPVDSLANTYNLAYIMGKFDPKTHPDFILIEEKYADRAGMYMHKVAYEAFQDMTAAAAEDSVQLVIRSAARNFDYQKGIWERKWTGVTKVSGGEDLAATTPDPTERALKILRYSSMPSTSRHHWGTDIDMNSFENSYFEQGYGKKVYDWLTANAPSYGFCQTYTPKGKERPNGYNEEKWHWSYLPIAQHLTTLAKDSLTNEMIQGFKGAETAVAIDVVQKYVLGINRDCFSK